MKYPGKCSQIGFEENETHCFLPNGSYCPIDEFENGTCGVKYQEDFCLKEGENAWKNQGFECCGEMEPYLPPNVLGQARCTPISEIDNESYFGIDEMIYIGAGVLVIIILISIILFKKKFKRSISNNYFNFNHTI